MFVSTGNPLITLTVIVGANIEKQMILPVVPADSFFIVGTDNALGLRHSRLRLPPNDLRQQPTARNHRMGFQKFGRCGSVHLRRNHAYEILFYADTVDGRNPSVVRDQFQCAAEYLVFSPLPVKTNPDHHLFQRKRSICPARFEPQTPVRRSVPSHPVAVGRNPVFSRNRLSRRRIVAMQHETDPLRRQYPDAYLRLPIHPIFNLPTIRCNALSSIHTSLKIARIFSAVIFTKSSLRGTIITPARSTEAGLTNRSVAPSP